MRPLWAKLLARSQLKNWSQFAECGPEMEQNDR